MRFDLKTPCVGCPFLVDGCGQPVRVASRRIREIGDAIRHHNAPFPCHKTTMRSEDDEEDERTKDGWIQCAGALLLLKKTGELYGNVLHRLAAREGLFKAEELIETPERTVFETWEELVAAHGECSR